MIAVGMSVNLHLAAHEKIADDRSNQPPLFLPPHQIVKGFTESHIFHKID